ncbi:hypothetical protein LEP1GSC041_0215 [Leptospira noguchii str. 2006001870]|nr:hypothetical protein LEP1GSC041_0215 [Leptospira noguchii str. 2006001870]
MGTITNLDFAMRLLICGNYYEFRFFDKTLNLWELSRI